MSTQPDRTQEVQVHKGDAVPDRDDRLVYTPATDITASDETFVVTVDMPGVDDQHVNVSLEDSVLTIEGQGVDDLNEGYDLLHRDYSPGNYERSFTLPADIDQTRIEARMEDGVLRLVLPKSKESQPRKIQVKTSA